MMTTDSSPTGAPQRALEPVDRIVPRIVPRIGERKDRARRDHKPEALDDEAGDDTKDESKRANVPSKSDDDKRHRVDVLVRSRFLPTRQILPRSDGAATLH